MKKPTSSQHLGRLPTKIGDWWFAKAESGLLPCVKGKHYRHSKSKAGEPITTATVRDFYHANYSLRIICEDGMEYELGEINPEYEEKYPGIIERTKTIYKKLNSEE